ncbi:MAG: bile acid:sodium symporter family protein [Anaerolineae bacterium]
MELLDTLYNLMSLVFVLGTMISMGLSLTLKQITAPLRNARFVVVALLANFVLVPAAAYVLALLIPLDETLVTGLILVSIAAGAPALPKLAQIAGVDAAAATGLMVLLIVATILIMPIGLPLLLSGVEVGFWDIASGLLTLMLIPLALSLFVRARWEPIAAIVQPYAAQASSISLLFLLVLMVVLNWSSVVSLFGSGGLLASILLVAIAVVIGYLLGGPGASTKWVQALGAGQRNIAAAMVVATANFGSEEIVMIVVYSLITLVLMTPLAGELGKRAKAAAAEGEDLAVSASG